MVRTKGIDMDHKVLCQLLDEHAPMKAVKARKLFHKVNNNRWATLKQYREFCSELLSITAGRIPHQLKFQQSLHVWLSSQELEWSREDEDTSTLALRHLLSLLLGKKRSGQRVPRKFEQLQTLVDKMHLSDGEDEDDNDVDVEEVECKVQEIALLELSDTDGHEEEDGARVQDVGIDFDKLEISIFAPPEKVKVPIETPAALANELKGGDVLFRKSTLARPILPADYRKAKDKKKKKKKKKKTKAKAKAKAKTKAKAKAKTKDKTEEAAKKSETREEEAKETKEKKTKTKTKDKTEEAAKKSETREEEAKETKEKKTLKKKKYKTKEEAPKETEAKKTLKKKKTDNAKEKMKHAEEMKKVGEDKRETEVDPDDDAEAKESIQAAFARYSLLWGKEDPAALKSKVHRYVYELTKKRAERKLGRALKEKEKAACTQAGREAVKAWTSIA